MPFRWAQVELICRYIDEQIKQHPASPFAKKLIIERVGKIVSANHLIHGSAGASKLSDETVTILIGILINR